MDEKTVYSHHIFLMPFKLKNNVLWSKSFQNDLKSKGFKYEKFLLKDESAYSEYNYFYDFAAKVLFNDYDESADKKLVYVYKYNEIEKLGSYCIQISKGNSENELFSLPLEKILFMIYPEIGIGVLSIHMNNYAYSNPNDILKINDFGRRIYPQFLPLDAVKGSFLANKIYFKNMPEVIEDFEDFISVKDINTKNFSNFKIPKHFKIILPESILKSIDLSVDDRMFTICWTGVDKENSVFDELFEYDECTKEYTYANSDFWHKYLFVDGKGSTCQSYNMMHGLLNKHTYDRWVKFKTLYGITRYSFVVFGERNGFYEGVILNHVKTMYFKMVLLSLIYRSAYLKFSEEITNISNNLESSKTVSKNLEDLFSKYLKFINNYYFKEVTAQEQGIDIFDKILEANRVKENIRELEGDFKDLFDYVNITIDDRRNELVKILTVVAMLGIPISAILAFFGINDVKTSNYLEFLIIDFNLEGFAHMLVLLSITGSLIIAIFAIKILFSKK